MDEVGLVRGNQRMHAALLWQVIALSSIAGAAGGDHVGPVVVATPRERNEVVARQTLAVPQLGMAAVAVLAAVTISGKEECVGDLTTEAAGNVDELDESDNGRFGKREPFASYDIAVIRFDDLGFAFDHKAKRPPYRDHRQRLKGGV
jgi:hypothetical protein